MLTLGEVISQTNFKDVFAEYKKHYEEVHRPKVQELFQRLKEIHPAPNDSNMVLFIRAIKENPWGEDVVVDDFDCDDRTIFFDVCGKDDDYEGLYSIASSPYEELLGYFIREDTLARFHPAQITAHILWALDW